MLFKNITMIDEDFNVRKNMYVGTKDATIQYIGEEAPDENSGSFGEEYDGKEKLLMPGFYNAHAHSPMTLMRGYGENMLLQNWLFDRIFPFEDQLTTEAVYYGSLLSMAESFRFGIVSTSDMYFFCEGMFRAYEDSGAKANMSRSVTCFHGESAKDSVRFQETKDAVNLYHNAFDGRVKVDVSVHAEYTNTEESIALLSDYMNEQGLNMHVHISETKSEHEECKQRHNGRTPARLFSDLGAFDTNATAAHSVWLEESDMDIFAEKNVTVATCPVCNLKLSSGVCNVPELLKRGVNVAIGTDGVASNNSLNYIEEMKTFAIVHKGRWGDPTLITPAQVLYAATRAGAKAQGRDDCGSIKSGNKADLIVLDCSGPHMKPVHNMLNNLVYSASGSDVALTMIDGTVVYKNGDFMTLDLEKIIYENKKHVEMILDKLSI